MYTNLNKININCNKMKYIKLLFLVICQGNISKFSYNFPKNIWKWKWKYWPCSRPHMNWHQTSTHLCWSLFRFQNICKVSGMDEGWVKWLPGSPSESLKSKSSSVKRFRQLWWPPKACLRFLRAGMIPSDPRQNGSNTVTHMFPETLLLNVYMKHWQPWK